MKTPRCVGVIMDGNRRWAKRQGLPTFAGHAAGYEKLKDFVRWAKAVGVSNVVAFAFSLENWNRTPEEVSYLMDLLGNVVDKDAEIFQKEEFRVVFAGDLSRFSESMQQKMKILERDTAHFSERTLILAMSYGGREEIVQAANRCVADGVQPITEADITARLYTSSIPDPDIIIRTSGEMRLSGFLLWQSTYSELFFTATTWPDFSEDEFKSILAEYDNRDRRMGK